MERIVELKGCGRDALQQHHPVMRSGALALSPAPNPAKLVSRAVST